jgi:glutamine synthetase
MHNDVAPGQYEVSPIFSCTNVSTDQDVLCIEVMHDLAAKHGLVVLFHEKPFKGMLK